MSDSTPNDPLDTIAQDNSPVTVDEDATSARYAAALKNVCARFKRTGHLIPAFLAEYELCENQSHASKIVGVGHDAVTAWKKDAEFMSIFTMTHLRAQRKNNDNLRSSILQRAINGTQKLLVQNGKIVKDEQNKPIIVREYETVLSIFAAKNRMPNEFRDKFEHEISGQLISTLAAEILSIVRRHVTPIVATSIQKELETLSAKMAKT